MDKLIEILKQKYNIYSKRQISNKKAEKDINEQINQLISTFDNTESFDEEDIEYINSKLNRELSEKFKKIKSYLKVIKKYPNQSQIKEAKNILEEIKVYLKQKFINENKQVFDSVIEYDKKLKVLKYYIDMLENYDLNTYISSYDLYNISLFLHNSEIEEEIVDFYNTVLLNNNSLKESDEAEELDKECYDAFIRRLEKINKSMGMEQLDDDKKIVQVLNSILEKKYNVHYEDNSIDKIIDIFNKNITSEEDKKIVNRIKFLIHVHNVSVELTNEQIDFINKLKDFYCEKIDSYEINNDTYYRIVELISFLEDDYKFENVGLLMTVFSNLEVEGTEQLKIISTIIKNNSTKKFNEQLNLTDSIEKVLKKNEIPLDYIDEDIIVILNDNLKNVTEVINHIITIDDNLLKDLAKEEKTLYTLINLLIFSSKEIINKFIKICNEESLDSKKLIKSSPQIIISNKISGGSNGKFDNFIANIDFCKEKNIPVKSVEKLLLEDNEILYHRYNTIKLYGVDITGNEFVLENRALPIMMDVVIESSKLGFKYLQTNFDSFIKNANNLVMVLPFAPELLVESSEEEKIILDEVKLVAIREKIKMEFGPAFDSRTKGVCLKERYVELFKLFDIMKDSTGRYYFVVPEKYDYIDESIFENRYISYLENPKNKFKKNEYMYNLDGCLISRIKFLRLCTFLNDILPKVNEMLDSNAIKYALRFEKVFSDSFFEQKIEHFYELQTQSKTKKKKKK